MNKTAQNLKIKLVLLSKFYKVSTFAGYLNTLKTKNISTYFTSDVFLSNSFNLQHVFVTFKYRALNNLVARNRLLKRNSRLSIFTLPVVQIIPIRRGFQLKSENISTRRNSYFQSGLEAAWSKTHGEEIYLCRRGRACLHVPSRYIIVRSFLLCVFFLEVAIMDALRWLPSEGQFPYKLPFFPHLRYLDETLEMSLLRCFRNFCPMDITFVWATITFHSLPDVTGSSYGSWTDLLSLLLIRNHFVYCRFLTQSNDMSIKSFKWASALNYVIYQQYTNKNLLSKYVQLKFNSSWTSVIIR